MKKALCLLLLFSALPLLGQRGNTFYVDQFPGKTVAEKATAAQKSCNANTSIPCILIFDPTLAAFPLGSLPAKCSQCVWKDFSGKAGGEAFGAITASEVAVGTTVVDANGVSGAPHVNQNAMLTDRVNGGLGANLYAAAIPTSGAINGSFTAAQGVMQFNSATYSAHSVVGLVGTGQLFGAGNGRANQTLGVQGTAISDSNVADVVTSSLYGGFFTFANNGSGYITHGIGIKIEKPTNNGVLAGNFGLYVANQIANGTGSTNTCGANGYNCRSAIFIEGVGEDNSIAFGNNDATVNTRIFSSAVNKLQIDATAGVYINSAASGTDSATTSGLLRVGSTYGMQLGYDTGTNLAWIGSYQNASTWAGLALLPMGGKQLLVGGLTPTTATGAALVVMDGAGYGQVNTTTGIAVFGNGTSAFQIGYATTGDYGWIGAYKNSGAWANVAIQPAGGARVMIGTATDNGADMLQVNGVVRATGYKSSDGTAGATVTNCTGFKNGLCVSGT